MLATMRRYSGRIGLLTLLGVVPMFSGCYGRFPLTHALYKFNGSASDNEIVTQVLFWVFAFFGIYGFAAIGDAIIFNLIEFWTGESLELSSRTMPDGRVVMLAPSEDGKTATLTVTKDGNVLESRTFVRVSDSTIEMKDAEGNMMGTVVKSGSGDLALQDASGNTLHTFAAKDLAAAVTK